MGVGAVWFLNRATESPTATETEPTVTPTENLLGHLPYEEAPLSELEPVSADGQIKLRRAAAERFRAMVAAAQQEGVVLVPLSGFRSKQDQDYLFFEVKEQRAQRASERALVSAPPAIANTIRAMPLTLAMAPGQTPISVRLLRTPPPFAGWKKMQRVLVLNCPFPVITRRG